MDNEHLPAPDDWGHPEYGNFPSKERLDAALLARATVALRKGRTPAEQLENWIRSQSYWKSRHGHVHRIPLEELGGRRTLTAEEYSRLLAAIEPINARIRAECLVAKEELQLAAERYVSDRLIKLPRGEEYDLSEAGHRNRVCGRYGALTAMKKGRWNYVIDFRSRDFPRLEESLARIEEMRAERRCAAEQAVAGATAH